MVPTAVVSGGNEVVVKRADGTKGGRRCGNDVVSSLRQRGRGFSSVWPPKRRKERTVVVSADLWKIIIPVTPEVG